MKLRALVEEVAGALREPFAAVHLRQRMLREAGHLSSGGRGRGGAEVSATDLGWLLLGSVAPGSVKTELPSVVERLMTAPIFACGWGNVWAPQTGVAANNDFPAMLPPVLRHLGAKHTLYDALTFVLEAVALSTPPFELFGITLRETASRLSVTIDIRGRAAIPWDEDDNDASLVVWTLEYLADPVSESRIARECFIPGSVIRPVAQAIADCNPRGRT